MARVLQVSGLHVVAHPGAVVDSTTPEMMTSDVVGAASDHGPFVAVVATGDVTDDGGAPGDESVLGPLESVAREVTT